MYLLVLATIWDWALLLGFPALEGRKEGRKGNAPGERIECFYPPTQKSISLLKLHFVLPFNFAASLIHCSSYCFELLQWGKAARSPVSAKSMSAFVVRAGHSLFSGVQPLGFVIIFCWFNTH